MRFLFWLSILLVAVVLALFAVANRETVMLGLWPLPVGIELPLYLTVLVALLIGFVLGAFAGWLGGGRSRGDARRRGRRIAALERELAATQAQLPQAAVQPGTALAARR